NRPGPDLYLVARDRIKRELPSNSNALRIAVPQAGPTTTHDGRQTARNEYIWNNWEDVNAAQREWLVEYEGAVEQFEVADRAGIFDRFSILDDSPGRLLGFQGESFLTTDERLLTLIRLKALEREHAGELAEAWDYHLKLIRFVKRALVYALPLERTRIQNWLRVVVFEQDLSRWQSRREQTNELLKTASSELKQELASWPQLYESYWRAGGIASALITAPPESFRQSNLGLYVPGWEKDRALAVIKEITRINAALARAIEQEGSITDQNPTFDPDRLPLETSISLPWNQQLVLKRHGGSSGQPPIIVRANDPRLARLPEERAYEGPWHLTETTFILSDYPLGLDFFNAIHDRPEPILIDELDFRIAVQNWLKSCETETPLSAPKPTQETP
ncbi:MAG TPA: hypothetical protein VLA12_02350, partial [Planctomycetaceae bacterium]|nr:hypothetical protein [Planctomycetaceae bacterium]